MITAIKIGGGGKRMHLCRGPFDGYGGVLVQYGVHHPMQLDQGFT